MDVFIELDILFILVLNCKHNPNHANVSYTIFSISIRKDLIERHFKTDISEIIVEAFNWSVAPRDASGCESSHPFLDRFDDLN